MTREEPVIVVIGATGFTGRLIARDLSEDSRPFLLAARDRHRLTDLVRSLERPAPSQRVDVRDAASLRRLLRPGDAVINCAGPFARLGEPVIRACLEIGAHYLDTTGEQPFMREMHARYHERAGDRGVAVVNAMAFEIALGDCAAAVAAAESQAPARGMDVIYAWEGAATSVGTRRTSLRMAGSRHWTLEDGRWRLEPIAARRRHVRLESGAELAAVTFGAGEVVTAPRHLDLRTARGWLVLGRRTSRVAHALSPALPVVLPRIRPLLEPLVARAPDPSPAERVASRFTIRVELEDARGERRALEVGGRDPYRLTAAIAVRGAIRALEQNGRAGVLAPSQHVDARRFLDELRPLGVTVTHGT